MASSTLQLFFLGGLSVQRDYQPMAELTSQKALALLCYLALAEHPYTRPALAGLLWGGMPESSALMNLRKALNQLRQQVGDHLLITRQQVIFNQTVPYSVDVTTFTQASNLLFQGEGIPPARLSRLEQAIALYKGDFLEGFYVRDAPEFEQWVLSKRAYLRELALQMMHGLAAEYAGQGRYQAAIESTRRLLRFEPWREEAHRDLMRLLALDGQRGAALAQYETCRRILQEELGVDASKETQALYQLIKTGNLNPPMPVPIQPGPTGSQRPAFLDEERTGREKAKEPFVGRENQISRLDGYLRDALAGQVKLAFVSAEAGWGKTSLLEHFSHHAQEKHPNLIVAYGICTTFTGMGDPYLPFREILRILTGDIEGKWAAGAITRDHALRIWDLLPIASEALVTHGRNLLDTFVPGEALLKRAAAHESIKPNFSQQLQTLINRRQDSGVNQEHIFEEYTDVLTEIAKKTPLVLILDDLHWVDTSSINLLFHLGRRLEQVPVLILGAYRPEDLYSGKEGKEHSLEKVLHEFKRLFGDTQLVLDQGNLVENRQFVDTLLDTEPNRLSGSFRTQLTRNTRGHPLFTVEMLKDMQERGDVHLDDAGCWIESPTIAWEAIPGRVEGVIEKRMNRLDPTLKKVLVTASVEGEEFTAEVIAQVLKTDETDMVRMLSGDLTKKHNLVQASGVVQAGAKRISHYQFRHNLFQKYLYSTLDPVERIYHHQAVGAALERLHQDRTETVAVHLARHFQEAGVFDKAVNYLIQAGETASRVYANLEAIAHFNRAIQLAALIQISDEVLSSIYTRLGRALELESSFDQALETYEAFSILAIQRANRGMELTALMARLAILSFPTAVHDPRKACELGERALVLAGQIGDSAAEAKILWGLSIAYYFLGHLHEAIACGERSLALARRLHLVEQMAQTLNDLGGFVYLYSGRIDQARKALIEASFLWRVLENTPMLADSLSGACVAHVYAGEFRQALAFSQEALELSSSINNLWGQSYSQWTIGDAFSEWGEYSRAIETMEECIRLGKQAGFLPSQTYTRLKLAEIYLVLGVFDQSMLLIQEALVLSKAELPMHIMKCLGVLARLQINQGKLFEAEMTLKAGRDAPNRESWLVFYLPVLFAEIELALHQRNALKALSTADELVARLRLSGLRLHLPEALYLQGKAFLCCGQDGAARESLKEAQAIAEAIGSQRTLWRILFALSKLEKDPQKAKYLRQDARRIVADILSSFKINHTSLREKFLNQMDVHELMQERKGN